MIDIHSHIIPNVDDGSSSLDSSLKMINDEINIGVTDIICTPHYRSKMFETSIEEIKLQFNKLNNACKDLPINLYLGQEIYVNSIKFFKELLDSQKFLTMNNTNYLLLEFSYTNKIDISEVIYLADLHGYKVIIAHIERYIYLKYDDIIQLQSLGALIQINAKTIIGKNGIKLKLLTKKLIKNNNKIFIASDIHENRSNLLLEAYKKVTKWTNSEYCMDLFDNNQEEILLNSVENTVRKIGF